MAKSTIVIDVELDEGRVPSNIEWRATESTIERPQQAKAFMLSIWDGSEKTALRIDLWTQKMMRIYKDEDLRGQLIRRGIVQAEQYTWRRTASLMWEAILQAAGGTAQTADGA